MPSEPEMLVKDWLETCQSAGQWQSEGRFSLDPVGARRLGGLEGLRLCDVPLLLLAGAVEAGSPYFWVHGQNNLRFSWHGQAGPCSGTAYSLLVTAGVDCRWDDDGLELPAAFRDYLDPLAQRCRHAPLEMIWGNQRMSQPGAPQKMVVKASRTARLLLVDRGVDFAFPATFPGWDIVAWVDPLPGAPWPRQLVWSPPLQHQLARIGRTLPSLLRDSIVAAARVT